MRLTELSALSLKHWRFVVVLVMGALLFGVFGFANLPRQEDPEAKVTEVGIYTLFPGATPATIEQLVSKPLEENAKGVEDVEHVVSYSLANLSLLDVFIKDDADVDQVVDNLRSAMSAAAPSLPDGTHAPEVVEFTPQLVATMFVVLRGDLSEREMGRTARAVKDALALLPEVKSAAVEGEQPDEVRVHVDAARAAARGVSVADVIAALKASHVHLPAGRLDLGRTAMPVTVDAELADADAVRAAPVALRSGEVIHVGDVARVERRLADPVNQLRLNGEHAIAIAVYAPKHTNLVTLGNAVRAELARLQPTLPRGVTVEIPHDQPASIAAHLGELELNLLEGMLLVALAVLAFLGPRAALVVTTALPLSVCVALGMMDATGFAFDQISIAALVIAIGMLVDDAVVVVDSVQRFLDRGVEAARAAVLGTSFVFHANNATTLTAIAAFLPLFLVGGVTGSFLRGIPAIVTFALAASLLVAQIVTPLLAHRLLRAHPHGDAATDIDPTTDDTSDDALRREGAVMRVLHPWYRGVIRGALAHPWRTMAITLVCALGAGAMFRSLGLQFFPKAEKPQFLVYVQAPAGTRYAVTDSLTRAVERTILRRPEVDQVLTSVGKGLPRLYYNVPQHREDEAYAMSFVTLKTKAHLAAITPASAVIDSLRPSLARIAGAEIECKELEQGPIVGAPVAVRIQGDDFATINQIATTVRRAMEQTPGAVDVRDDLDEGLPQLSVAFDRERIARAGLTPEIVAAVMRSTLAGVTVARIREEDREIPVRVEATPERGASTLESLTGAPLPGFVKQSSAEDLALGYGSAAEMRARGPADSDPQLAPLGRVIDARLTHERSEIVRRDLRRVGTVRCDVHGALASAVLAGVEQRLASLRVPEGYTVTFGGENEERDKSFASLGRSGTLALLLIYAITILQFNSLLQPVILVFTIPLAAVGAIAGLYVTRNPFGFSAFLGLVALTGIVVNHKIYLIDRINTFRAHGMPLDDAIIAAGHSRLRPVVLTALTAIGGLLPLALSGHSLWSPFGGVVIAGLLASTVLSLIVMPVIYRLVMRRDA